MNKILISTRKGLIEYERQHNEWKIKRHHFEAIPVTYTYQDSQGTWWACLDHGHWGIKLSKSHDHGKSWIEVEAPKYPKGFVVKEDIPAKTEYLWCMSNGGQNYPDRIWMGTIPGGLFVSEDRGETWELNLALWNHPSRTEHWFGAGFDHPGIHSILVDPRNNDHIIVGISVAGAFETVDGGLSWQVKNKGLRADFLPDPSVDVGHDPHLIERSVKNPDILWQQNHCGVFVSKNNGLLWEAVSHEDQVAHFGFAIAIDPNDANCAYIIPAKSDEYRVAINQSLCVCRTDDGGKTWKQLRNGLPQSNCYDIVYRHALAINENDIVFGTTTGNVFWSNNKGESWTVLNNYLPMVHAVTFVR